MIEIEEEIAGQQRSFLVGLEIGRKRLPYSLAELSSLSRTAGMEVAGENISRRSSPHPATYVGRGKAEEIRDAARRAGAAAVIFNDDLTPNQIKNLQRSLGLEVLDRTVVILRIFAARARTREARLQIELAQLKYQLPRLAGAWSHLSRQKGGARGTRDAGEKQLEVDRRTVRKKVHRLEKELKNVRQQRAVRRKLRRKKGVPVVAIIGYTNAGKSTLLNALTGAGALVEDKLFATLDPSTRQADLPSGRKVLFSDTVGFIRDLPHHLIDSFRATLEEVGEADLLLQVLDASRPRTQDRRQAVARVLEELRVSPRRMITALNKIDLVQDPFLIPDLRREIPDSLPVSARDGRGMEELLKLVDLSLNEIRRVRRFLIPQNQPAVLARLYRKGKVLKTDYHHRDIYAEVLISDRDLGDLNRYLIDHE